MASPKKALAIKLLSQFYPSQTHLPHTPSSCIFHPHTAAQVSHALFILRSCACPFSIKSGGHGSFNGEQMKTLGGSVVIDLARIRHVRVFDSADRETVEVGPGNTWGEVYAALEPLGLTVVGGRAAGVGVGGFLLGGGISWFSNLYGLGADNVVSFEVVLATGAIVTARRTGRFADLYRALRGGAGNFGVVTSFTLAAHPYSGMWAGRMIWGYSDRETVAVTDKFLRTGAVSSTVDAKAFVILALTTAAPEKDWVWATSLVYCESVENPVAFDEIWKPDGSSALEQSGALRHQTQLVAELNLAYPSHLQHALWTISIGIDTELLHCCAQIWVAEMQPLLYNVDGFKAQLVVQYITSGMLRGAARNGGNTLGLGTEPFLMLNSEPQWEKATDTRRVHAAIDRAFAKMTAEATRRGLAHGYVYCNYASQYQDPMGSYGVKAKRFMSEVSRKYDPEHVFQRLRDAGFKLSGAPKAVQSLRSDARL